MTIVIALLVVALLTGLALGAWLLRHLREQSIEFDLRLTGLEQELALRRRLRQTEAEGEPGRFSPPARTLMNDWELPDLRGGRLRLSALRGERLGVIFVQPDCPASQQVLAALAAGERNRSTSGIRLIVITTGDATENQPLLAALPVELPVLLQEGIDLARVWRVPATPSAHVIDRDGISESELLQGPAAILTALGFDEAIERMADELRNGTTPIVGRRIPPPAPLPAGSHTPVLAIPRHPAGEIAWGSGTGMRTLLVFADSACAACRTMVNALGRRRKLPLGLQVAIVARGSEAANRELLDAVVQGYPVAFPPNGAIARAFGVTLTPSAIVIEPDGTISASGVAGAREIEALLDRMVRETRARQAAR